MAGSLRSILDNVWALLSTELLAKQDLTGTKALICGAGNDIGRQIAIKLARSGVYLILWDNSNKFIDETLEFLQERGINRVRGHVVDFLSLQDIKTKAEELQIDYGELDFVFNNLLNSDEDSGLCEIEQCEFEQINSSIILYNIIKTFLPSMLFRDKGHFITLTSAYALFGCAAKGRLVADSHSVIGLMDSLRLELNQTNIKTTTICAAPIKTWKNSTQTSWLISPQEPDSLAKNIIEAVEYNQQFLLVPKSIHILLLIRNMTPMRFSDLLFNNISNYTYKKVDLVSNDLNQLINN